MKKQEMLTIVTAIVLMMAPIAYGAPPRTAGVTIGHWASYLLTYEGNSTSVYIQDLINMTSATFTVLDVTGTNVTVEAYSHYINGSETTETGWIDVDTGQSEGNATGAGMMIAADLSEGDLVYTTEVESFMDGTINETIARSYLGGPVTVNHFVLNVSSPLNPYANMSMQMDWYWFKDSGVLAEISMDYEQQTAEGMTWYSWHMTISNTIPEFPAVNVALVLVIATLLVVVLSRRRVRGSRAADLIRY